MIYKVLAKAERDHTSSYVDFCDVNAVTDCVRKIKKHPIIHQLINDGSILGIYLNFNVICNQNWSHCRKYKKNQEYSLIFKYT